MWVQTAVPALTAVSVETVVGAAVIAISVEIAAGPVVIVSGIGKFQTAEVPETVELSAAPIGPVEPQRAPVVLAAAPASVVLEVEEVPAAVVDGDEKSNDCLAAALDREK
jgi:hypothetical protein